MDVASEGFRTWKTGIWDPLPDSCIQDPSQCHEPTSEPVASLPGVIQRLLLGLGAVPQSRKVGLMGDGYYFIVWFSDKGVRKKLLMNYFVIVKSIADTFSAGPLRGRQHQSTQRLL